MIPRPGNTPRLVMILAGLSLFLSSVEMVIPKPLPVLRLGLANLAVLIALGVLPFKEYLLLLVLKVLLQGLVSGTLFSPLIVLSAGGTFSSGLAMRMLYPFRGKFLGMTGISLLGALFSNGVQLTLAGILFFGQGILFLAPPFFLMGIVSSFLLGLVAERFVTHSAWFRIRARGGRL